MRTPGYRLHKPSGLAFIEIRGKRHYLGKHGTPKSRKKYAAKLSEYLGGAVVPAAGETTWLPELIEQFLEFVDRRYVKHGEPTSEVRSFRTALGAVLASYPDLAADEFGPTKLLVVRQMLKERGYCRRRINGHLARIRRCWQWGVSRELVAETVWRALMAVEGFREGEAPDNPKVQPTPLASINAIKPFVSPTVWGLVQFILHTGCRPGEACMIRTCDLKMSGRVWEYRPESHKTEHHGKSRVVFVGPKARAVLKPFLRVETHEPLFQPRESREWFLSKRRKRDASKRRVRNPKKKPGLQYTPNALGHSIAAACRRAKVETWTPNQLRHTAATLIRSAFGIEASRVVLGHATAATSEIYAQADLDQARDIARRIG